MLDFEIFGLSGTAWYTIVVIVAMFLTLMFTKIRTEVAFTATITALLFGGVLSAKDAFAGMSSSSSFSYVVQYTLTV